MERECSSPCSQPPDTCPYPKPHESSPRLAVVQLVEAPCYKAEGRGFEISLTKSLLGSTQPLTEMSTRNVSCGGKGGRCLQLTTLPLSCADCLEIWEPHPPGTLRACTGFALPLP